MSNMLRKKKDKLDTKALEKVVAKKFAKDIKRGHYCVFREKHISMKDIINDEKQFRMCVWCRLNNLVIGFNVINWTLKGLEKANKGEERPDYIG